MIDMNQKVEFSDSVFAQEVDGEMVLLDMESENYFGLDSVGSAIWNAIAEKKVLKDVYEKLLLEYDVEPEVLQKDLNDFVQKLVESGLVKVSAV
jgi:hypothetical protein